MFREHTTPAPPRVPEARMSRLMDDATPYDADREAAEEAALIEAVHEDEAETFAGEFAQCWCGQCFDDEARCRGGHPS